jgi:hypothetical protein
MGATVLAGDAGGALKASPCLGAKPSGKVSLAILPQGSTVSLPDGAPKVTEETPDGSPVVVCVDEALGSGARDAGVKKHVVAIAYGLAVVVEAEPAALSPVPADEGGWRQLRLRLKDDAQQVGCLKKLPVGTALYDKPDGAVVGRVIDGSSHYGKWDFVQTKTSGWAQLRVSTGFAGFALWIKDRPRDWCPP